MPDEASTPSASKKKTTQGPNVGMAMMMVPLGAGIGVAIDNLVLGAGFGCVMGLMFGGIAYAKHAKKSER